MFLFGHVALGLLAAEGVRRLAGWRWSGGAVVAAVLGALAADVVDKPLGHVVLDWGTGRLWGHTLLGLTLLGAAAFAWRRRPIGALLALGAAAHASHLALDMLWRMPAVALWPLLGPMPQGDFEPAEWSAMLRRSAWLQATEAAGAAALALAVGAWWRRREAGAERPEAAGATLSRP